MSIPAGGERDADTARIGQRDPFDMWKEARPVRNNLVHRASQPDLRPRASRGEPSCRTSSDHTPRHTVRGHRGRDQRGLGRQLSHRECDTHDVVIAVCQLRCHVERASGSDMASYGLRSELRLHGRANRPCATSWRSRKHARWGIEAVARGYHTA